MCAGGGTELLKKSSHMTKRGIKNSKMPGTRRGTENNSCGKMRMSDGGFFSSRKKKGGEKMRKEEKKNAFQQKRGGTDSQTLGDSAGRNNQRNEEGWREGGKSWKRTRIQGRTRAKPSNNKPDRKGDAARKGQGQRTGGGVSGERGKSNGVGVAGVRQVPRGEEHTSGFKIANYGTIKTNGSTCQSLITRVDWERKNRVFLQVLCER